MRYHDDMGARSTKLGQAGEQLTRYALAQMGFMRIRRIYTGWRIIRFVNRARGLAQVAPTERVDGDFAALHSETGQAVLVEAKLRSDRLRYSDLAQHQVEALDDYNQCGALAYVVWVSDVAVYVMPWPCLRPGESLTDEQAAGIATYSITIS